MLSETFVDPFEIDTVYPDYGPPMPTTDFCHSETGDVVFEFDGEDRCLYAWRDILSTRNEYFATSFPSNNRANYSVWAQLEWERHRYPYHFRSLPLLFAE